MTPKQKAQMWLEDNCLILDTETTGLGEDAEIVEISLIDCSGETLLNTLVKPRSLIPASAIAIHGITNAQVMDAPSWPEVFSQLCPMISGRTIVIYNRDYDTRLLDQTNDEWGVTDHLNIEWPKFECAMLAYAEFYGQQSDRGGYRWQKLTAAAEQQGVKVEGAAHRALSDCLTTLGIIKVMATGGRPYVGSAPTAQYTVNILNKLLHADPDTITNLVDHRVECSDYFAGFTTATVGARDDGANIVGMIGIINALIFPEVIAAVYDGKELTGFTVANLTIEGGDA
ncbi:3'-5' exonuclease [Serratia proteamaculans]|uniref:3'-5' exonuclease n=1 Tax=Serratia proteamaculans TaxID=28151 RepID=UPI0039AEE9A2